MDVSPVATQPIASANGRVGMTPQDFLKVLITQLQNQDPMQPMQSDQMLNQMATIQELESSMRLSQVLEGLADNNRVEQASVMIGKFVRGDGENAEAISGVVTGIRVENGKIVLELDNGTVIPLEAVKYVAATTADSAASAAPAGKQNPTARRAPAAQDPSLSPTVVVNSGDSRSALSPRREIKRWIW